MIERIERMRTDSTMRTVLAMLLFAAGCASSHTTRYMHPAADLGAIRTVAVLPFTTLTTSRSDAEKVEKIFLVELLATGAVEVVEPGQVAKLVGAEGISTTDKLAPADLQRIGQALGADGLFLGTVVDFVLGRSGNAPAPEVTIQLRLVETASGTTAWSSSETRSGASAKTRLFGFGGDSLTEAARRLISEQLQGLVKE